MSIVLNSKLIAALQERGVSMFLHAGQALPDECVFEPPCSLKWMGVQHSLALGAFSYAVSGFYFGCRIGRYCSFGEQVQIGRHPHPMHWVTTSPFFYTRYQDVLDQPPPENIELAPKDFRRKGPPVTARITSIENDVWIGHGAFILPGLRIGTGAAVAAMSVVTHDVPDYAVVAGSPARVVKYRFPEDQVAALLASRWWEFAPWTLKGAPMDDIPAFVDFVRALRDSGAVPHAPEKVSLAALAK